MPNYDVAYFERTAGDQDEWLNFGEFDRIQAGDKVIYIGWDFLKNAYNINTAIVLATGTAIIGGNHKIDFIEFEGDAIPGYSGGPVFNFNGKVIGMIREAWKKQGIRGGKVMRINRAFSTDLLRVLDSEIITGSVELDESTINTSLFQLFSK